MKKLDFEPTTTEIVSALGAAFITIGSTLPPQIAKTLADRLTEVAEHMERDGDTRVGTLCRAFADSLALSAGLRKG